MTVGGPGLGQVGPAPDQPITTCSNRPRPWPPHQLLCLWFTARPGPSNIFLMGRGPARGPPMFQVYGMRRAMLRPVQFSDNGPRFRPAHHSLDHRRSGPVRPIKFQYLGPARPGPHESSKIPARPGNAHVMSNEAHVTWTLYGPVFRFS